MLVCKLFLISFTTDSDCFGKIDVFDRLFKFAERAVKATAADASADQSNRRDRRKGDEKFTGIQESHTPTSHHVTGMSA